MALQTCPTEVVRTPAERVWHLLTTPAEIARWSEARLLWIPTRPLQAGDRLVFGPGIGGADAVMNVLEMEPPQRLVLDIALPFGITNHETIVVTPMSASECRVTYN